MTGSTRMAANVVETVLDVPPDEPPGVVEVNRRRVPWFRGGDGQARLRVRLADAGRQVTDSSGRVIADIDGGEPVADASAPVVSSRPGLRHLLADGDQPFLWIADTWWYGFSDRISDAEFAELVSARRQQGYSVAHIVAGLYPETLHGTADAATDGRWSWTKDADQLDPAWWDAADRRLQAVVAGGILPAVVGAWSYYLLDFGPERIRTHWREIVARWAAFPGIWVAAGEVGLMHYEDMDSPRRDSLVAELISGWRAIVRYVKQVDPYPRPTTVHPCPAFGQYSSTDVLGDRTDLGLSWLQTGHGDRAAVPGMLAALRRELATEPLIPVINSESCYEGILGGSGAALQRFLAWSQILAGAAGHSYGAQGEWAFRVADAGPGIRWGETTWQEAVQLPGGRHVGLVSALLADVPWHQLESAPDSFSPVAAIDQPFLAHAAAGADHRVVYLPAMYLQARPFGLGPAWSQAAWHGLGSTPWQVQVRNPRTGATVGEVLAEPDAGGDWPLPAGLLPTMEDWLLVAKRAG